MAHAAALLALLTVPWPTGVRLAIGVLLLASAGHALRPAAWTRLVAGGAGRWWLFDRAGVAREARQCGGGVSHPWLVTLSLRLDDGARRRITVWADAVPADDHAALRRWLAGEASGR